MIEVSRNTASDTYLGPYATNDEVCEFWDALRDAAHQPHAARLMFEDTDHRDAVARVAWTRVYPGMEWPF